MSIIATASRTTKWACTPRAIAGLWACRRYHLAEWLRGWSLHTTGSRGHFDDDADRYGQRRPADHVRP
jgi:hypothetical protein